MIQVLDLNTNYKMHGFKNTDFLLTFSKINYLLELYLEFENQSTVSLLNAYCAKYSK